jgi:mannose-6-phosphate isomerase-like protein (cupin superfamily)
MEMLVRHRDEGRATWFVNGLAVAKADAAETRGAYALAEHLLSAASNPPRHVHNDEDEAWFVLDGEIEFDVDGTREIAHAGSFVFAPAGAPHTFQVLTDTARVLVLTSSSGAAGDGGFEHLIERAGSPASAPVLPVPAPPDPVALTRIAAECGIAILPPEEA